MTDSTSGTLLERFRARDEGALADLYDLMGARAYGLAFRVLHDGAAAEDVVQNAFATLWEQADRLDPGRGSIEGLLLTIVHRRAVDAARSRQRQSTRPGAAANTLFADNIALGPWEGDFWNIANWKRA